MLVLKTFVWSHTGPNLVWPLVLQKLKLGNHRARESGIKRKCAICVVDTCHKNDLALSLSFYFHILMTSSVPLLQLCLSKGVKLKKSQSLTVVRSSVATWILFGLVSSLVYF